MVNPSARVAMTGANGFLGWHTRCAMLDYGFQWSSFGVGEAFDQRVATTALESSEVLLHLAGVNRGDEVSHRNPQFATQVAEALGASKSPPQKVVFGNSIQAGNSTKYGVAKEEAAHILSTACAELGIDFVDIRLPNLFGEHGRPNYNSVAATFCQKLASGETPEVQEDRELTLLHAQNAADVILGKSKIADHSFKMSVGGLLHVLEEFSELYTTGDIPDIASPVRRDLFNTYRSYVTQHRLTVSLSRHADNRGTFCEIVRSHGGSGQSSFSTTIPGVRRGDHFHRRKVERFTVLSGLGIIRLRRLFDDTVFEIRATGDAPIAVDMPTMWAHSIENGGDDTLFTSFWTDDLFDLSNPDTISEAVER